MKSSDELELSGNNHFAITGQEKWAGTGQKVGRIQLCPKLCGQVFGKATHAASEPIHY